MRAVFQPPASIVSVVLAPRGGKLGGEADAPGVPGDPALDAGGLGRSSALVGGGHDAGVVDEDVDLRVRGKDRRRCRLDKVLRSEVELDDFGDASECAVSEAGPLTVSDRAAAAVQRLVAMSYKAGSVAFASYS